LSSSTRTAASSTPAPPFTASFAVIPDAPSMYRFVEGRGRTTGHAPRQNTGPHLWSPGAPLRIIKSWSTVSNVRDRMNRSPPDVRLFIRVSGRRKLLRSPVELKRAMHVQVCGREGKDDRSCPSAKHRSPLVVARRAFGPRRERQRPRPRHHRSPLRSRSSRMLQDLMIRKGRQGWRSGPHTPRGNGPRARWPGLAEEATSSGITVHRFVRGHPGCSKT
jgi:hypothetical protein